MRLKKVKYKEKLRKSTSEVLFKHLLNKCAEEKARNWVGLPPERGLDGYRTGKGGCLLFILCMGGVLLRLVENVSQCFP